MTINPHCLSPKASQSINTYLVSFRYHDIVCKLDVRDTTTPTIKPINIRADQLEILKDALVSKRYTPASKDRLLSKISGRCCVLVTFLLRSLLMIVRVQED